MYKFQRVYNWLSATYCAVFILYLFNLAVPPNNMPIFITMLFIGMMALSLSRSKKKSGVALLMIVVSLLLIVKERNDGVALKGRLDKALQQTR